MNIKKAELGKKKENWVSGQESKNGMGEGGGRIKGKRKRKEDYRK
jgi:hypothetical protein